MKSNRIVEYKDAKSFLDNYVKNKSDYIYIHYARQNCFEDAYEKGPRIIIIAAMNAGNEQTMLFSLKKIADAYGIDFFEISESEQDEIEMEMLQHFFEYAESNAQKKWLHWNMKNNNFGFSAIEERYHNLGGDVRHIDENSLFNISQILKKKYGDHYAKDAVWNGKVMGKMYDIFQMNKIEDSKILNGEQEIKEYILKNITSIEQSTFGKVKAFKVLVEKAVDNDLKVRGNIFKDVYGPSISGIAQFIQDNAILAFLFSILGGVIATLLCKFVGI